MTQAEYKTIAGDRFNSELALFLLVASENDFWVYSWFWDFEDYIPHAPNGKSTVLDDFYPDAKCPLGAPKGPFVHTKGTLVYAREFEHASVFVDVQNHNTSKVTFHSC